MVTHTQARPGDDAAVDRAATQAVDDLTAFVFNELDTRKPMVVRGVVTAVTRDSTGINEVSIQRTGQHSADPSPYVVYAQGFVPIVGDRITLQKLGSSWLVVGADHGGRPNEHTIAYTGGSHRRYNAARVKQHEHFDTHHAVHYATDGATVAHHNHPSGHKAHTGDHVQNATTLAADGTPSGVWHRKTHNATLNRYEHNQAGVIVRHHAVTGDHGHYSDGQLIHNIVTVGAHAGQTKHKQHNTNNMHAVGDDGTGAHYALHASGARIHTHDGLTHTLHFVTGNAVQVQSSDGNNQHKFLQNKHQILSATAGVYHEHGDSANRYYVKHGGGNLALDHDGTTGRYYAGGLVSVTHNRIGTSQSHVVGIGRDGTAFHKVGDDGTGLFYAAHGLGNRVLDHDGTTMRHYANGVVGYQIDAYKHYFRSGQNWEMARVEAAGSTTSTGGGRLHVKQLNSANTHILGDDGAGRLHGQHASGSRAWDHDGVAHRVYGGGRGNINELVRFEGAGSSNGSLARFGQANTTLLHGVGDDGTGKFYAAHANGNRVLDHDGTLWQQYAANVVAVTHDGQAHRVYSSVGGYAEVARHQSSGAGGGGQLALKLYNTTTAQTHLVGDDGAGKFHLKHGAGNKVLDHDGTTLQHYAGGVVAAQYVTSGSGAKHRIARSATTWHELGEDGTGKLVATINGVKGWDHDGTTATTYGGGGLPATTHDGTTHTVYGVGTTARIPSSRSRFISGNSAVVDIMRDGTNFHSVGDDGAGLLYLKHGLAGRRVLDHDGTTLRHYGGGVLAATHNGSDFSTYIGAVRVASMQAVGSSARQFLSINTGNLSHWIGDDTTGNLSHFSNGQVYLYTNANTSGRKHTFNGDVYTLPQGQTMDSGIGGASEVRLLPQGSPSGYGKGAIKQSSHSTTILTPSVGATVPTTGGSITNGGGSGDANLAAGHFKFAGANLCYGTAPSTYRHGNTHPAFNSGYGINPEGTGNGGTGFTEVDTHSDGGMYLYGTTYSGAAWSGTAYFQTEVIN